MTNQARVILHVGGPKTGSTYIQKRLRLAPDLLRKKGIYVPVLPEVSLMAGNAKLLPVAIDKNASKSFMRAFPYINLSELNPATVVAELIKDWRRESEVLVLSAENFRSSHAQVMRDLLPHGTTYAIKLFIRRQDSWVDSYFNQLTKTNDINESIDQFVTHMCEAKEGRIANPDWYGQYHAWSKAFGHCEVINFEDAQSDLLESLLPSEQFGRLDDYPDLPPEQVSIGVFQMAYLLQLDADTPFPDFILHRNAADAAARTLDLNMKRSLLSPEARRRLQNRFELGNSRLLSIIGKNNDSKLLEIEVESNNYCDLNELYNSKNYAHFQERTKQILTQ
jgi:hypothetical protein